MPRKIKITIYKFNELPTEEAKESARQALREVIAMDPAWAGEHRDSWKEAEEIYAGLPDDISGPELAAYIRENYEAKYWEPAVLEGTTDSE